MVWSVRDAQHADRDPTNKTAQFACSYLSDPTNKTVQFACIYLSDPTKIAQLAAQFTKLLILGV